ncbi:hypothetical protein [Mycobacteroides chelonae]|nr:hypothetical protein [Mycobacteroides chelonae]
MAEPPRPPERGFRDCFDDLVERKGRELGAGWDGVPRRSRRAEAARRARVEMARRIAVRGGRRYAESTIARWAARNHWPPGVETFWLERWALIDRAGGIAALAELLGISAARIISWRDSRDPDAKLPARPQPKAPKGSRRIGVAVNGYATIGTTVILKPVPWKPGQEYQALTIDADSEILEAWYDGDEDLLMELLGPVIADQVISEWASASHHDVDYRVTEIYRFFPDVDE